MNNEQENAAVAAESLHADALSALTGTPAADDKDYLLVVEHLKNIFRSTRICSANRRPMCARWMMFPSV